MIISCIYSFCFWSASVYLMAKIVYCSPVETMYDGIRHNDADYDDFSAPSDCESYLFVHTSTLTANDTLVVGGYEIEYDMRLGLHICRANHNGNMIPGKRVPGACYVAFEGQGFGYRDHEVLINPKRANLYWVTPIAFDMGLDYLPEGAIRAGWTNSDEILYPGRCYIQQNDGNMIVVPGYVNPSEMPTTAHVVFGNYMEYACDKYEILVCTRDKF